MSIIKKMRRQKAIYWERSAEPDEYGRFTYAEPVEIDCRWDSKVGEFRDERGNVLESKATVYVDREMKLGDELKEGPLESDTPSDPRDLPDAFEIQAFEKIPNLKATETLYIAHL